MKSLTWPLNRRRFMLGAGSASLLPFFSASQAESPLAPTVIPELSGTEFHLTIDKQIVNITGRKRQAITVNGSLPGPTLRMREGDTVTLHVTNNLDEDSSIHWHGFILPAEMDGVPGISFDGIKPGETFTYQFTLQQSGTYWYHSHSGYQEPLGLYGAIVIDPRESSANKVDREHIVLLSDWSDEQPAHIYANLKKLSHYYNTNKRTLFDWIHDVNKQGLKNTLFERQMWNQMRMTDSDIADVTGMTYSFLINGNTTAMPWLGEFTPGEKVLLRIINGSSMSIFDVRIPGLKLKVIAADGQAVQPIDIDEFRIGTAETYDVIIEPLAGAYTLFAQSIDRSAYVVGTLTSDPRLKAIIPEMDHRPLLTHSDMGMGHGDHNSESPMDHSQHNNQPPVDESSEHDSHTMNHSEHGDQSEHEQHAMPQNMTTHSMPNNTGLGMAGMGTLAPIQHTETEFGPQVDMRAEMPQNGVNDPGVGLRDHLQRYGRRVLNYSDLRSVQPTRDTRQPNREIQLHLTGNMNRYMWSMDGIKFADAEPLLLQHGERVRFVLVNDTMMTHPIHLHGLWSELETGDPNYIPRKHTVLVQPGSSISYLVTADAEGRWAYHCHLLYHMAGMFREVQVVKDSTAANPIGGDMEEMQHGGHHEDH